MSSIDLRAEIRDFLSSRRARISPEQAGLPSYGGNRRVKGLRREEVAMLAGVSADYYVRMERGNLAGASDGVLEALASALKLDDAERDHLFALARESTATTRIRHKSPSATVRAPLQQILDAVQDAPAWIRNARHDILAMNPLAAALSVSAGRLKMSATTAAGASAYVTRLSANSTSTSRRSPCRPNRGCN